MRNIACTKIIFCETEAAREVWGPEALHLALLPSTQELPALTEQEEAQLAAIAAATDPARTDNR